MNFTSSYKAFVNQISKVNGQGPCLASIFGQTLYYILVSNSNFYDFKISSELQSFTPYMNFPDSNYSYKNSQCLISLTRGGRLKLSPWSVIDPRFSSKYSWLYICYILCRNYFWVAPLDNRAKIKPIFQPKHNLFTLNYISTNSNDIIQSPNYVFNPVISLILGPMTEFNLTKFFKTNKRFLKWPYYGFSQQFLNNFFTSFKTKRYKSIVAEGFMGPCEIAYLSRKKHRILRRTTFKNRGTWFRKFRRNRKYCRRFFALRTKPKPSERNLVNKKRNNNYYKRFIFTFWKQIFGFYL